MWRIALAPVAVSSAMALASSGSQEPQQVPAPNPLLAAFVEQHCAGCHESPDPDGELDLVALASRPLGTTPEDAEAWSWVVKQLESGSMPPAKRPRPPQADLDAVLALLEPFRAVDAPPPPAPGMRRLNRRELHNTLRDLLGVELPEDALPPEPRLHTYDVVGSDAGLDDTWMDRWFDLALEVAERAIALPNPEPERLVFGAEDFDIHRGGRLVTNGYAGVDHLFRHAGTYRLSGRVWAQQAGPDPARVALVFDEDELEPVDLVGEGSAAAAHIELELEVEPGYWSVGVAFLNDYWNPDAEDPGERDRNVIVEQVVIEGPLEPRAPGRFQRELFERFGPELGAARARAMLDRLARLAWRRRPTAADLDALEALTADEPGLEARLRLGLGAILSSPRFLFVPRSGDDHALATRLALGLWGALPDEALLDAVERGELADAAGLLRQADRLLADERAERLARGFVPQWLQLERLAEHRPDPERFGPFRPELVASMLDEPVALFAALLREDRPISDLLSADWTIVDARLAEHYGLPFPEDAAVDGRARLPLTATERRGVLGHAAVLTASSDPGRTSPVLRGKWVLEALLGDPPPPPPPGVLTLDETAPFDPGLTIRQRLEQHRTNAGCASCHASLDPLGFALEGFDAVGRARAGADDLGQLPDGTRIEGALGLASVLRDDPRFPRQLAASLATWMRGAPVPAGAGMEAGAELDRVLGGIGSDPSPRELLRAIIVSDLFRAPTGRGE